MNTPQRISPNFFYHEFFSKGIWQTHSASFLRKMLDPRLVPMMQLLRTRLNRGIFVNTWFWNSASAQYRGFRPQNTTVGALYSQHKMGRAIDFKVSNMSADSVRSFILNNEAEFMETGLTRMEDGRDAPTWVHLDLAWTGEDHIVIFRDP